LVRFADLGFVVDRQHQSHVPFVDELVEILIQQCFDRFGATLDLEAVAAVFGDRLAHRRRETVGNRSEEAAEIRRSRLDSDIGGVLPKPVAHCWLFDRCRHDGFDSAGESVSERAVDQEQSGSGNCVDREIASGRVGPR
jgi:hypothetical protein